MRLLRLSALFLATFAISAQAGPPLVQSGTSVAFLGDSITQGGASQPSGYVRLVESGLAANDIKITVIPAGISGHKSNDMLARLDRDVLQKMPNVMTLSCGVNDVWHGPRGVKLEDYKKNITEIVTKAQAAGIKVVILTSTPIQETPNANNTSLATYNEFLRELAKEKNCALADLSASFWAELEKPTGPKPPGLYLTSDGVHMNPLGNEIMAVGVLKALGLSDAQVEKARTAWLNIENSVNLKTEAKLSLRQYKEINALAARNNKKVSEVITEALAAGLKTLDASAK